MKQKTYVCIFSCIFIVLGIVISSVFGFAKLAKYNSTIQVEATVIVAKYENGEADVSFTYIKNGEEAQTSAHFKNLKYENGSLPYYAGKVVTLHINENNEILQFGKTEIVAIVGGVLFFVFGVLTLYIFVIKKPSAIDLALEYEKSMVDPNTQLDKTASYEAVDDKLTKLPSKSIERMFGEADIWKNRISDRFKTFTVWQNILLGALLIIPIIIMSVYPLFFGKTVSFGSVIVNTLIWIFIYSFSGLFLKTIYNSYLKTLVKLGKFSEKKLATVVCSAFDSSLYYQFGNRSRTYTVFKKFRVVANIDGKRSVGYIKGNVPPPQGAILKVLIRPHHPKKWIIDKN